MFSKICCAYDCSPGAVRALDAAIHMAKEQSASLCVLTVQELPPSFADNPIEPDANEELEARYAERSRNEAEAAARGSGVAVEVAVRTGHPAQCIVKYLEEGGFDLLVIGHSGHSEIWGRFLGSTVDKVVRHAPCSVLVVRGRQPESPPQQQGDAPA
jgi:nucleotide-binding universal stress UspA family protein